MLPIAMYFLSLGIATIPIFYKSKVPALKTWIEFQTKLPTEVELNNWFSHKFRNLAVITGWQNLVVLDFDNFDTYFEWYNWAIEGQASMVAQYGLMAVTRRGIHVYVKAPNAKTMKLKGLDIKAQGGYVLAPPSLHPSGLKYTWINEGAPILEVSSIEAILPTEWISNHYTEQPSVKAIELDPFQSTSRTPISLGSIGRIKEHISILSLLPNAKPTRQGWYVCLCPFHQDVNPSFWIDTNKQLCGCYSCGFKPMDVINLASRLFQVDNREAIFLLAERI